jgi:hypothetical protein
MARVDRGGGAPLALEREGVLRLARHAVPLGHVLGGPAHQDPVPRVGEDRLHTLDAAQALVAAGSGDAHVPGGDLPGRGDDRLQPGAAEPVHVHGGRAGRDAGGDRGAARVVRVRPDLRDLAEDDLVDLVRPDAGARGRLGDAGRRQLVRVDVLEGAPVAADRRPDAADDGDRAGVPAHARAFSSRLRIFPVGVFGSSSMISICRGYL